MTRARTVPGALDLCEGATHLLRQAPAGLWAVYLSGTVPFTLVFLTFWSDMAVAADAPARMPLDALFVTALFLWMKTAQALFGSGLHALAAGRSPAPLTPGRMARTFQTQAAVQPFGLLLLPLSALAGIPFGRTFAFYQNAAVLDAGEPASLRERTRRARGQASLWPLQNHVLLAILLLAALMAWLNAATALSLGPELLKTLLGVETVFTRSGGSAFNGTFLLVSLALAVQIVDPLVKAAYAVRCFHGEARTTGEDIRYAWRGAAWIAAILLAAILATAGPPAQAAPSKAPPAEPVRAQELDQALDGVLARREFVWRQPRREITLDENSATARFLDGISDAFHRAYVSVRDAYRRFRRWWRNLFPEPDGPGNGGDSLLSRVLSARGLTFLAGAALLGALVLFLLRLRRARRSAHVTGEALAAPPDLSDESVTAADLPENGWRALAAELSARGEYRLALRALFLALLASLAERGLLSLARAKTNGDYRRELARRARYAGDEKVVEAFGESVRLFEGCWYGNRSAGADEVKALARHAERTGGRAA